MSAPEKGLDNWQSCVIVFSVVIEGYDMTEKEVMLW